MHLKKAWVWLSVLVLLCLVPGMAGAVQLRGYEKGNGWQYAYFGEYPYEADGTTAPVLWRILEVCDGQMLMMTEYIIDTQQVVFESDPRKIERNEYRTLTCYADSDLYTWMNTVALDTLLGDDPVRDALIEEPGAGKFIIFTMEQFLNASYGFSPNRWDNQPTRHATGTPYAIKARGLFVDYEIGKSPYWAADIKSLEGTRLALVGNNGHLSWGGYTRTNVGIRPAVRLDLSGIAVQSGAGTRKDPFVLTGSGGVPYVRTTDAAVTAAAVPAVTKAPQASATPRATAEPRATATPKPTERPVIIIETQLVVGATAVPAVTATPAPAPKSGETEVVLSFVGDCSIGDSAQYVGYAESYHKTVDSKGYEWPFSLVKEYLAADSLTIANLEAVLTTKIAHTDKMYNLKAAPDHVNVLTAGSVEMVNTVNNHCMDFHRAGYADSLANLDSAGVGHFGSVYTSQADGYDDMAVREVGGIRIGFIGFSYPQESDKKRIANRVRSLKEEQGCDLVVVSLHWGREVQAKPEAGQVAFAKEVIDAGADVIYGHHPHVIQPIHFYKGKPILYSTGNFTFGTMSQVDPATGIFQLAYEMVDGRAVLNRLQVIPCKTQGAPDYRPYVLTDPAERTAVFRKLRMTNEYAKCDNLPESFLETGVVLFENGNMLP